MHPERRTTPSPPLPRGERKSRSPPTKNLRRDEGIAADSSAVHPTGLVENWAVYTDFNGSNDLNHVAYLQALVATGNELIVYNHYPWGPTAEIFDSAGAVLAQASSDPSGQPVLETVQIDPAAHFYYACFLKNNVPYVSIFNLTKDKLLQTNTDATFYVSECN